MKTVGLKLSGIFFLGAGILFVIAYLLSKQVAFVGVGVMFLCIGGASIAMSKQRQPE